MAWTAPKVALMLSRMPQAQAKSSRLFAAPSKLTSTSPRQLASMEKSGVGNNG